MIFAVHSLWPTIVILAILLFVAVPVLYWLYSQWMRLGSPICERCKHPLEYYVDDKWWCRVVGCECSYFLDEDET